MSLLKFINVAVIDDRLTQKINYRLINITGLKQKEKHSCFYKNNLSIIEMFKEIVVFTRRLTTVMQF